MANKFAYNKKIDDWSWKMIKNIKFIWGNKIQKQKIKISNKSIDFISYFLNMYIEFNIKKIISMLNEITNLNFKEKDFSFYLNTSPVSLHNAKDMFISISINHSMLSYPTIIIHELSHIYFYKYIESDNFLKFNKINKYQDIISDKEKNEIKEIITIIINSEFKNLIYTKDIGYPNHKKLREKIYKKWQKNKDFNKLIKYCIKEHKKRDTVYLSPLSHKSDLWED